MAKCEEGQGRACRVSAKETVVPAGTRTIIEGRTTKPLATGSWIIEPQRGKKIEEKILTAKVIIQGAGTCMPVEVMNPLEDVTHQGIVSRLPRKETICSLEEGSPGSAKEVTSELQMELEDLLDKIEIDVDQEERSQIRQLIKNHEDVFSLPGQHLGHTDLVKHDIVTPSQAPIKSNSP